MPQQPHHKPKAQGARTLQDKPFRVLLVDHEPKIRAVLAEAIQSQQMVPIEAASIAEAKQILAEAPVDLALIDPNLPDGSGIVLANEIKRKRPITQTIVITGQPSLERAVEAIRAGAADFIAKPLDLDELNERVKLALNKHKSDRRRVSRLRRLRRVCKKLNQAHEEVSQQVDILCNDLVTAYQELAAQIHDASETGQFTDLMRQELDLEQVLRKTLEHLLEKAGPTNAAIFLPAAADEYSLGGYVNYDRSKESADLLLQHLASVVAPAMGECDRTVCINDDHTMAEWFGDDWDYLAGSHMLAAACRHDDETLAVVVLFRDQTEPFDDKLVGHINAIGPLLGGYLAKVIRIHHRHFVQPEEYGDDLCAGF